MAIRKTCGPPLIQFSMLQGPGGSQGEPEDGAGESALSHLDLFPLLPFVLLQNIFSSSVTIFSNFFCTGCVYKGDV